MLELTAKVTVVLTAVYVAGFLMRRSSAATRHLAQIAALAVALLLPLAAATLPTLEIPVLEPSPAAQTVASVQRAPDLAEIAGPASGTASMPESRPASSPAGSKPAGIAGSGIALNLIPVLWIAGSLLVLTRLSAGWWRVRRWVRIARPLESGEMQRSIEESRRQLGLLTAPPTLVSSEIDVPMLWGFVRPVLLLPEAALRWPAPRLRIVLLHELAHLRRYDGLALLLGRVTAATWWFHPLAWIVESRARRDCERACDDVVLACGERPSSYAGHLLEIAEELPRAATPAGSLALTGPGPLESRVMSILHPGLPRGLSRRVALILLTLGTVGLLSVASTRFVARAGENAGHADRTDYLLAHDGHDRHDEPGAESFERAYELHRQERFAEAIVAFEAAADAGFRPGTSTYNAACGMARLGQTAEAIEAIERALASGFERADLILADSDLDPLRRDAEFRAMVEQIEADMEFARKPAIDRYGATVQRFEELSEAASTDGRAWYKTGSALLSLRELDRSVDALERAAELLAPANQNVLYNLACAHALAGDAGLGIESLRQAVFAGFDSRKRFDNDSDLDNLRGDPRFDEVQRIHDALSLSRFGRWHDDGSEYSAERWAPAAEEFGRFVREYPDAGRGWYDLGWSLHFSRRHAEARDAFLVQLELDYRPVIATYNIACTYAMQGRGDEAFEWLDRAVAGGGVSASQIKGDEDLESLRADPRFAELIERAAELRPESEHHGIKLKRKLKLSRMEQPVRQY